MCLFYDVHLNVKIFNQNRLLVTTQIFFVTFVKEEFEGIILSQHLESAQVLDIYLKT